MLKQVHQKHQSEKYLRLSQIIGDRQRGIDPILPIGRSTFLRWVKNKKAPAPLRLGKGVTVWRESEILAFAEGKAE